MLKFDERKIKLFSTIGQRATFGLVALDLVKILDNLIILTSDVSTSAGLDRFRKMYPENYYDVGIAEQNLIGVATGLASEGFKTVTTTFAPFQTTRCCEQIKVNLGYMQQKVILVGLASGISLGNLGFTHCCIEDFGILRSIPNITIISPADSLEVAKTFEAALYHNQSCYIRLTGTSNNPIIYKKDYKYEIGKSIQIKNGNDLTIFSNGSIINECLLACEELKKNNIDASLINMHTVKPIDETSIKNACIKSKMIVSVEEHNIYGGLGSAIAEVIAKKNFNKKLLTIGIDDYYEKGGNYDYLKEKYGLNSNKIVSKILSSFRNL